MITLQDIVNSFFKNYNNRAIGEYLFDELKNVLGEEYSEYSIDEMRDLIKKEFENYGTVKPSKSTSSTNFDRNMRNWLTINRINRRNILTIACVLHLDDKQCDQLLNRVEQHSLHYGGDIHETILTYCLKNNYDFNKASRLFACFSKIKTHIENDDGGADSKFTNRTESNKEILMLTVYKDYEKDYTKLLERLNIEEAQYNKVKDCVRTCCDSKTTSDFNDFDYALICHLLIVARNMSDRSNRTFKYIEEMRQDKDRGNTANTFYSLFYEFSSCGEKFRERSSIDNVFSNCKDGYSGASVKSQPTRDFILLFSTMVWCNGQRPDISLRDYVDLVLDSCGYGMLDEKKIKDGFIVELSNFSIGHNMRHNILKYKEEEIKRVGSDKMEVYKEIVKAFVAFDKISIMDLFELENKRENKFFSFDLETIDD